MKIVYFLHVLISLTFAICAFAYDGKVTYEKFYRLNKPAYQSESGDWIGLSYKGNPVISKVDAFFEGDFRLYFQDNNSFNYSLQEAYVSYKNANYDLYIGRKTLDWNENEKYWSLGYLNSLQAFTLLSTEEEGVTGIHFNQRRGEFEYDILLSYLFIPQVNPSVDFKNGEVHSKSEWMRLPPTSTVINGTQVPIYYKVKDYQYSKILLNKSLGFNLKYKYHNGIFSAFAIYKPENKLRINAEAYYDNVVLNKVVVEADPTVNHHAYYGVQWSQAFGDVKVKGGLSYVDPNAKLGKDIPIFDINNSRKTFDSDYFKISPRYDREAYSHFSANIFRHKYDLTLNYVHLLSKNIRGSDDFFSDTVKWKRAVGMGITYYFNDKFSLLADFKYDLERFDNIIRSEVKYNFRNLINVTLGLEMLKAPKDNSYWSYYRAADTVYSAVGFYF